MKDLNKDKNIIEINKNINNINNILKDLKNNTIIEPIYINSEKEWKEAHKHSGGGYSINDILVFTINEKIKNKNNEIFNSKHLIKKKLENNIKKIFNINNIEIDFSIIEDFLDTLKNYDYINKQFIDFYQNNINNKLNKITLKNKIKNIFYRSFLWLLEEEIERINSKKTLIKKWQYKLSYKYQKISEINHEFISILKNEKNYIKIKEKLNNNEVLFHLVT